MEFSHISGSKKKTRRLWQDKVEGRGRFPEFNDVTVGDSFPIPVISDVLDSLRKAKYFSTVYCASGFWQIPVRAEDRPKTAFSTENGHYEYKSMLLGLRALQLHSND